MSEDSRPKVLLPVLLLLLINAALRLPLLGKPLVHDEVYYTSTYLSPAVRTPPIRPWAQDWRRQLTLHPPSILLLYRGWIRLFGDSDVSLRVLPFLIGLAGLLSYLDGAAQVFSTETALLSGLILSCCLPQIEYSTQALNSIFEQLIFLLSLGALARVGKPGRRSWGRIAVLNVIGLLLFYHYLLFLYVQTLWLFLQRRRLAVPGWLIWGPAAVIVAASLIFGLTMARSVYALEWFQPAGFMDLLRQLRGLPFSVVRG